MGDYDTFTSDFQLLTLVIFIMDFNVATFEQLKNSPCIGEHRAQAILDVRAHLDRHLTLLDLTLEAGIPGDVMRSIIYGKLILSFRVTTESLWIGSMITMKRTLMGRLLILPGR